MHVDWQKDRPGRRALFARGLRLGASAVGLVLAAGCGALPSSFIQPKRTVRVGLLVVAGRAENEAAVHAFLARAAELGWRNGENLLLEERWGNGQRDAMPALASELTMLPVDVLVASGTAPVQAAKHATDTIPIVMTGLASDPIANGFVASLARPGGNITGLGDVQPVLSAKRVEILADVVPGLKRLAVLVTAANPSKPQNVATLQTIVDRLGMEMLVEDVILDNVPRAFDAVRAWSAQALHLIGDAALQTVQASVFANVEQLRVPAIYSNPQWVDAGGLMSYGEDIADEWRQAAEYVDKILRGAKPADLPVALPTRFPFTVNTKAAEALNLTIPPAVAVQVTRWVWISRQCGI
jgi:putative ABC transport system substrate-binding protein